MGVDSHGHLEYDPKAWYLASVRSQRHFLVVDILLGLASPEDLHATGSVVVQAVSDDGSVFDTYRRDVVSRINEPQRLQSLRHLLDDPIDEDISIQNDPLQMTPPNNLSQSVKDFLQKTYHLLNGYPEQYPTTAKPLCQDGIKLILLRGIQKSGTTYTEYIVENAWNFYCRNLRTHRTDHSIWCTISGQPRIGLHIHFFESSHPEPIHLCTMNFVVKLKHEPPKIVNKAENIFIETIRDPRDTTLSFSHFTERPLEEILDDQDYFNRLGGIFSKLSKLKPTQVYYMWYEFSHYFTEETILGITSFFRMPQNMTLIHEIQKATSMQAMRSLANHGNLRGRFPERKVRQGQVCSFLYDPLFTPELREKAFHIIQQLPEGYNKLFLGQSKDDCLYT
jgi:hypothetical protein